MSAATVTGLRVLVTGGRDYEDVTTVWNTLNDLRVREGVARLIHGGASGADALCSSWARAHDVPVSMYGANWAQYGNSAGPIRNQRMLDDGRPDVLVAFPGGAGTADMVRRAARAGLRIVLVPRLRES